MWRCTSFFLWHYWSRRLAATTTILRHGVAQRFLSAALSWRLPHTLEADFCVEALEEAFGKGRPDIFSTDQSVHVHDRAFRMLSISRFNMEPHVIDVGTIIVDYYKRIRLKLAIGE